MAALQGRDQLRYVLKEHMALSVMTDGVHWMPQWFADSWDTREMVHGYLNIIFLLHNYNYYSMSHSLTSFGLSFLSPPSLFLDPSTAVAVNRAYFDGSVSRRILLDQVICDGSEDNLLNCSHSGIGISDCSHNEDAGVICNCENYLSTLICITFHLLYSQ